MLSRNEIIMHQYQEQQHFVEMMQLKYMKVEHMKVTICSKQNLISGCVCFVI